MQGQQQSLATYLTKLRMLLDAVRPALSGWDQLDITYRNLHPFYSDCIRMSDLRTLANLRRTEKEEEQRIHQNKAYRRPPLHDVADFPVVAYVDP